MSNRRVTVTPAREGIRVPVEGQHGTYFDAREVRTVRHTKFVEQLIREGDLRIVGDAAATSVENITEAEH